MDINVEFKKLVSEDSAVPANCAGGGQVAGIGQGAQGEPGVSPKKKRKSEVVKAILSRTKTKGASPWWTYDRDHAGLSEGC